MKTIKNSDNNQPLKLCLWPGVVIVTLQLFLGFIMPIIVPETMMVAVLSGFVLGLAVFIWWVFFSRAPMVERWGALLLIILVWIVTKLLLHESISTGNMGLMYAIYSIPFLSIVFVVWAVATKSLPNPYRRILMTVTIVIGCGVFTLFRSTGLDGNGRAQFDWRWSMTSEEKLLGKIGIESNVKPTIDLVKDSSSIWPNFRGANRNGIIHNVRINANWKVSPPIELWRKAIGPGCSSFSVLGALLFTQEQHGALELVTCYNLNTGELIWVHSDSARFWDSHAGAGPRSTPTISNGHLYTIGATGILNAIDAINGNLIWSHNVASETNTKTPIWAFSRIPPGG